MTLRPNASRAIASLLIFSAALFLRLQKIDTTPWHPDEGDVAELVSCLSEGKPMAVGAVRQTAFFPLSASPIAPYAASLAVRAGHWKSLPGLRRWSAFLGALGAGALDWFLWGLVSPLFGVLAGLSMAILPLAVALQQMGFYHHLSALLSLACLILTLQDPLKPSKILASILGLSVGLAVASAYWMLWLLLLPPLVMLSKRRWVDLGWSIPGLVLPLGLVAAWSVSIDAGGFWREIAELGKQTDGAAQFGSAWVRPWVGFFRASKEFPALPAAVLGLACWAWASRNEGPARPGRWTAIWALLSVAEVFRQRQNLESFAYPLILALGPMACGLGAALTLGIQGALRGRLFPRFAWLGLALLSMGAMFKPAPLQVMRLSSAPPLESSELAEKIISLAKPGDLVMGQPNFNWAFAGTGIRATDLEQAGAWQGDRGAFLISGLEKGRFAFEPDQDKARFIVISPYSTGISFELAGPRRLALRAEMQGWPKIWSNGTYDLFANPALGYPKNRQGVAMLRFYNLYDRAALDALDRKDLAAAEWALSLAQTSKSGDVAGRDALLARIRKIRASEGAILHP